MKTLATKILKISISALLLMQILKTSVVAAQDVIVDVTSLTVSGGIGHDCSRYLENKHDETNHWQRCTVCGRTYNIRNHTYQDYWTIGDAQNCDPDNHHVFRCTDSSCGYQYLDDQGRAEHQPQGGIWAQHWQYACRTCSKCISSIVLHYCTIGGRKPGCQVWGTCDGCGLNWDRMYEFQVTDAGSEVIDVTEGTRSRHCYYCQIYLLDETLSVYQEQNQPAQTIYTLRLDLDPQVSVQSVGFGGHGLYITGIILRSGYVGTDIFILLAGIGAYQQFTKHDTIIFVASIVQAEIIHQLQRLVIQAIKQTQAFTNKQQIKMQGQ